MIRYFGSVKRSKPMRVFVGYLGDDVPYCSAVSTQCLRLLGARYPCFLQVLPQEKVWFCDFAQVQARLSEGAPPLPGPTLS